MACTIFEIRRAQVLVIINKIWVNEWLLGFLISKSYSEMQMAYRNLLSQNQRALLQNIDRIHIQFTSATGTSTLKLLSYLFSCFSLILFEMKILR